MDLMLNRLDIVYYTDRLRSPSCSDKLQNNGTAKFPDINDSSNIKIPH